MLSALLSAAESGLALAATVRGAGLNAVVAATCAGDDMPCIWSHWLSPDAGETAVSVCTAGAGGGAIVCMWSLASLAAAIACSTASLPEMAL